MEHIVFLKKKKKPSSDFREIVMQELFVQIVPALETLVLVWKRDEVPSLGYMLLCADWWLFVVVDISKPVNVKDDAQL